MVGRLLVGQEVGIAVQWLTAGFAEKTSRPTFTKDAQRGQERWAMAEVMVKFHQILFLSRPAALKIDVAVANLAKSEAGCSEGILAGKLCLVLLHDMGEHLDQARELVLCHWADTTTEASGKLLEPSTRSSQTELLANSTGSKGCVGLNSPTEV